MKRILKIAIERIPDPDSDLSFLADDPDRVDAYRSGQWEPIGIRAIAYVDVGRPGAWHVHKFTSAGLWGIESDSDQDYLSSVAADELAELRDELVEFGFSDGQFSEAAQRCETVDVAYVDQSARYSMHD